MSYVDIASALVKKHEGLRLKSYIDSVGATSIGYGRNLRDVGVSEEEADFLHANDMDRAILACEELFPSFDGLTDNRKAALVDMMFNMGYAGLSEFKKLRAAIANGRYMDAADEMMLSQWARQVGSRAIEDSDLMRNG